MNTAFQFSAHQQINPVVMPELYGNGDDLTALSDIHIPDLLPPINADLVGTHQPITEDYMRIISQALGQLYNSVPNFPLPNFIPNTPLHNDVNIQAEMNKIIAGGSPTNTPTPTPAVTTTTTTTPTTTNTVNASTNTEKYNHQNSTYLCQPHWYPY